MLEGLIDTVCVYTIYIILRFLRCLFLVFAAAAAYDFSLALVLRSATIRFVFVLVDSIQFVFFLSVLI